MRPQDAPRGAPDRRERGADIGVVAARRWVLLRVEIDPAATPPARVVVANAASEAVGVGTGGSADEALAAAVADALAQGEPARPG